jgi:hypothetical protein
MHKRFLVSAFAITATALAIGSLSAVPAMAQGAGGGQPCSPGAIASGNGTQGTPWALKSMYARNAAGAVTVAEEFQVSTSVAGQVWAVTFAVNGTAFFTADVTSAASGVREAQMTPYHGGASHVTAHAVNEQTGEVADGAVDLPAAPACGR